MNNSIIIIDVESNGFRGSSVVEVAMIKYDIEQLLEKGYYTKRKEIFHRYYWPVEKENKHAVKVHGLNGKKIYELRKKSNIKYAKYFKDDNDVHEFLKDVIGIVGHNISFDISFFPKKYKDIPTYCTMLKNRSIFNKNPKLSQLVEHFNIKYNSNQLHSALYDTVLTSFVFKYMIENNLNNSRDWLNQIVIDFNSKVNLFDLDF